MHTRLLSDDVLDPLPRKYLWKDSDSVKYRNAITSPEIQMKITQLLHAKDSNSSYNTDVDDTLNLVNNIYYDAASIAKIRSKRQIKKGGNKATKCSRKRSSKNWYDSDCRQVQRDLSKLGSQLTKDPYNVDLQVKYRFERKKYKRLLKRKKVSFQNKLLHKLTSLENEKPKVFWKIFDELNSFNKVNKSNTISAEEWIKHFQGVVHKNVVNDDFTSDIAAFIQDNVDKTFCELNFKINATEIIQAISKLKNGKSSGNDSLLNEMIKCSSPVMVPVLEKLFNQILTNGIFPNLWRTNYLTPLHKKGDINCPSNYRGIAVSSTLSKLFCSVLHSRLSNFFKVKNTIPVNQIGYKSRSRTSDHIFTLKTIIDKYTRLASKQNLYCCFVDFKSAFDTVRRDFLIFKLIRAGVGGNFLKTIQNMYTEVNYCIKLEKGVTSSFSSNTGVKQGCVLSPILFNLYLADLPGIFDQSCGPVQIADKLLSCLMFADDLILISTSQHGLQTCLNKLSCYCQKWHLTINISKTKVMVFSKSGRAGKKCTFFLSGQKLEISNSYCYLGVTFSPSGSFKLAINTLVDKATRALFKLRQHNLRDNVPTFFKLFHSLVSPIFRYACEVWCPFETKGLDNSNIVSICDKSAIEKLNNKICKYLLGVHKYSSNMATKGDLGSHGFLIDCMYHSIKLWTRLCDSNFDQSSLVYKSFLENHSNASNGGNINNWCHHIKQIFEVLGFSNIWSQKCIPSSFRCVNGFLKYVKKTLYANYENDWKRLISINEGKLRTYKQFKSTFELENYILFSKLEERKYFSRIRISAHRLQVEIGRHKRPKVPLEDRTCCICNHNSIEDEKHFIVKCPSYHHLRSALISDLSFTNIGSLGEDDTFKSIMSCNNGDVEYIAPIIAFVKNAYLIRFP